MAWIKAAWIPPMFAAFNLIAPNRAKGSDGTIGDYAHQSGSSGHNPDDTPGSNPERQDADNIAEVRAADVTTALNSSMTMEQVVQRVLATPAERDRLIYIIFNRRIWRKSNGWRQETYTGSDPHTGHAHFSGDPASDTDAGQWSSITSFRGGNMAGETADLYAPKEAFRVDALAYGSDTLRDGSGEPMWAVTTLKQLLAGQAASATREVAMAAALTALATAISNAGGSVDVTAIKAHIDAKVAEVEGVVAALQADLDASQAREAALQDRLSEAFDNTSSTQ
jgi:hypothetical protein